MQELYKRKNGSFGGLSCGTGATAAYCAATPTDCQTIASDTNSNLYNGCLYAARNGFTSGGQGGRQRVTFLAKAGPPIPTAPNVTAVQY